MNPSLNKKLILAALKKCHPQWPDELLKEALENLIESFTSALKEERPIVLRGFGRLWTRRYKQKRKELGLIFHPSPKLKKRLKKDSAEEEASKI